MLLICSLSDISDAFYHALNVDASQCIQHSFSSLSLQSVRSAGLFVLLRCLIPKHRCRFNKLLEVALISEYVSCLFRLLTTIFSFSVGTELSSTSELTPTSMAHESDLWGSHISIQHRPVLCLSCWCVISLHHWCAGFQETGNDQDCHPTDHCCTKYMP